MSSGLALLKMAGLVAVAAIVGKRVIPAMLDRDRRHPVARAVHAHRARARDRHRRRRRRLCSASRWRSAPSSPAWSSAAPTTASAPRPKRCQCATRSPCCSSSRSGMLLGRRSPRATRVRPGGAGHRHRRQAAAAAARCLADAATRCDNADRGRRRSRRSASSRSSSSTLGRDLGVLPAEALDVVVATSIISIMLNPLAFRAIEPLERWLARQTRGSAGRPGCRGRRRRLVARSATPRRRRRLRPDRRTVTRLLRENGISPTVVELNMDTVRALRQEGMSAVYGDARHHDTLVTAGLRHAGTLIVSGADTGSPDIIQGARAINPGVHIFVRAAYLRDVPPLRSAGAEQVFSGEGEVALAMTEAVLRRLGATPDQIDRERARVREELMLLYVASELQPDLHILHRFSHAQRTQSIPVGLHVASHFLRISPRILPQRPADRFPNEEVLVGQIRLDAVVQQLQIRLALEPELTQDRGASLPHVLVLRPPSHQRLHAASARREGWRRGCGPRSGRRNPTRRR